MSRPLSQVGSLALLFLAGAGGASAQTKTDAQAAATIAAEEARPKNHNTPLEHLATDPRLQQPEIGYKEGDTSGPTYWIAHRYVDEEGGSGWGWVRPARQGWDAGTWVALHETPGVVVAPQRKLVTSDADLNWEYRFWGTIAKDQAYDPHLDEMVPVFILTGYEVLGLQGPLAKKAGPPDREETRSSRSSSRAREGSDLEPGV